MKEIIKNILIASNEIQKDAEKLLLPPSEGKKPQRDIVLTQSIFRNTRGYIEKIVYQINGSYENGWYDACAVMIRRLIETLIIEVFEYHKIADRIQNQNKDFYFLKELINSVLTEKTWNLSRNSRQALPRLKNIGDLSAHSRRYVAHRADIDKIVNDLRIVSQELLFLANLK